MAARRQHTGRHLRHLDLQSASDPPSQQVDNRQTRQVLKQAMNKKSGWKIPDSQKVGLRRKLQAAIDSGTLSPTEKRRTIQLLHRMDLAERQFQLLMAKAELGQSDLDETQQGGGELTVRVEYAEDYGHVETQTPDAPPSLLDPTPGDQQDPGGGPAGGQVGGLGGDAPDGQPAAPGGDPQAG